MKNLFLLLAVYCLALFPVRSQAQNKVNVDFALWRNDKGKFEGVIQGLKGDIPPPLLAITKDWARLSVPTPLPPE
ncbi:MAG TPA: hypothetical protein VFI29_20975 [Hanamia sp.]|nr:hypothetical protein [Hanamia sp.]